MRLGFAVWFLYAHGFFAGESAVSFGMIHVMRLAITFAILAIVVGLVVPYLLHDRVVGMGITLPRLRGSSSPAPEHHVSGVAVMRFLRVLGVCLALLALFCFASSQLASRREASTPDIRNEI